MMEITKKRISGVLCIVGGFVEGYDKEIARMSICEPDGRKHRNRKWTMSRSEIWHSKKNDCRLSRTQVINLIRVANVFISFGKLFHPLQLIIYFKNNIQ